MASVRESPAPGRDGQQDERDHPTKDLNDLLNPEQRREFISLVANTMDLMEQFLAGHPTSPSRGYGDDGTDVTSDSYERKPSAMDGYDGPSRESRPLPRQRSAMEHVKIEAELARHFGAWRESVLSRIGEVVKDASPATQEYEKSVPYRQHSRSSRITSSGRQLVNPRAGQPIPAQTTLNQLPVHAKLNIIDSLLLLLLSLEHYSAYSRTLLVNVCSSLGLHGKDLIRQEIKVAKGLIFSVKELSGEKETKAKAEQNKVARRWKVGAASVAGAALIGVTGGLAAPLVAAGLGAVMGTLGLGAVAGYLGAVAGSSVIVGGLFGAYGARMSGRMMDRYTKEVKDFAFIPIRGPPAPSSSKADKSSISPDHRLRVTIGISGWLTSEEDIVNPWLVLGDDADVFALRWELRALLQLGNALTTFVRNTAITMAGKQVLSRTVFAPIVGALMVPLVLQKVSKLVDNPFRVAQNRADKAGEILADALVNKAQGERPVTLIGYSLGARVIFACLTSLAKRRAFGLIENAVLIGAPTPSEADQWRMMRSVVSGRLINVFSENDSVLRFLYRTNSAQFSIAGLEAITDIQSVENFDVSNSVSGHLRYQYMIGEILQMIGMENLDGKELRVQADKLRANDEEEDRRRHEREEKSKLNNAEQSTTDEQETSADVDREVSRLEREIEEHTEEGLMQAKKPKAQTEEAGDN